MDLKKIALVFGVVLAAVGVLGFVPGITTDGMLLGIFQVDALHNGIHLLTGIAAIAAGMTSAYYAQIYFKVFGIVYALVTVLGFLTGTALVVAVPVNMADNILHLVIAAASLYLGFMGSKPMATPSANPTM